MKHKKASVLLAQVAAFVSACSDGGGLAGVGGSKKSSSPSQTESGSVQENGEKPLIVLAEPETREEYSDFLQALSDKENRDLIRQNDTGLNVGAAELASALDDELFVSQMGGFNEHYESLSTGNESSRSALLSAVQEIADYMEALYPNAVQMLVSYHEQFPADAKTEEEIQRVKEIILPTVNQQSAGQSDVFNLQSDPAPGGADPKPDAVPPSASEVAANVSVAVEVAVAANAVAAANAAAVTNVVVVAEVAVCIALVVCPPFIT